MNNVRDIRQCEDRDILGEASAWLARLDRGLTSGEEEQLGTWLETPAHREIFIAVAEQWDRFDALARLADLFPPPARRRSRAPWRALATAAALVLGVAALLLTDPLPEPRPGPPPAVVAGAPARLDATIYETAKGENSTITLRDGSQLALNTDSRIRVSFLPGERHLTLERGEVHIQVAHDKARPLRVFVGGRFVEAVGTAFNLEIGTDDRVELIVTEGRVVVGLDRSATTRRGGDASGAGVLVSAGERLVLGDRAEAVEEITPEELKVTLSWRGGSLIFRGEPLAEAIAEIERYTPVTFVIRDESLKSIRVAGLFKAGDVDGLLATLEENFNVTHERIAGEKILLKTE